ncbi:MAG: secretin N-terminal domain-containing protein, partial [Phycisphaerales bacterium]
MPRNSRTTMVLPAALMLAAGQAAALRAQDAPALTPAPAAAVASGNANGPASVAPPTLPPSKATLSFAFKETPWDQVLDFFARQSGVPMIFEATAPAAPVTFISASDYSLEEALDIVNRMLWMHGLQLRREPSVMMLSKLEDAKARSRQFTGQVPESVGNAEVVTLVLPLNFALASQLADKLNAAGLVGKGGGLVALPQQNSVVIVETAAQVRRIREMIQALDNKPAADAQIRLFKLQHAEAATIQTALKSLVAEKRQTIIIDKDGQQRRVNEEVFEGLTIQPDVRTNSLLAVGTPAKLKTVEEIIALLDKPEEAGSNGREMTTFAMGSVSPDEAIQKLNQLFAGAPDKTKPSFVSMPAQGKLAVVATAEQARAAAGLLAELDPGSSASAASGQQSVRPVMESRAAIIELRHIRGDAAQQVLTRLLTPRQTAAVRLAAMPDQRGIIVSGPSADVEMVRQLLGGLDQPGLAEREVKIVRIGSGDLAAVLAKAQALYAQTGRDQREAVQATIEPESRSIALVGSKAALASFTELLSSVQAGVKIDRETRLLPVRNFKPSDLAGRMQRLLRPMLEPRDGSDYTPPTVEPVDELSMLVVRAGAEQLQIVEDLTKRLDTEAFGGTGMDGLGPVELRSFRLRQASPAAVAQAVRQLIATGGGGIPMAQQGAVAMTTDEASKMLIVTGPAPVFATIEKVLGELDMQSPGSVVVKAVRIVNARAERIAPLVQSLMERDPNSFRQDAPAPGPAAAAPARGARPTPRPGQAPAAAADAPIRDPLRVVAETRSNSLILTGPVELIGVAEKVITELDVDVSAMPAAGGARSLRVIPLSVADAGDAALAAGALFADDAAGTPPTVRVDKASNALLVRGTDAQIKSVEELVSKLDQATASAGRDMRVIQVDRSKADATAMAEALRRLLQQRGGVKVEVISAEDLIKRSPPADKPASKPTEKPSNGKPTGSLPDVRAPWWAEGIALSLMTAQAAAPAEPASEPGEAPPSESTITIAVDPATNSLVIVGAPKLTQRAADLLTQLQQQMPAEPTALRIVTLAETVDARTVAGAVNGLVAQIGSASAANPGGLTGRVSVQADPDGDALIVSANDTDFAVVGELIGALSRPKTAAGVTVKVYPLSNAPAAAVLMAGRDLFSASPQGRQAQRVRQIDVAIGENGERAVIDPALIRFTMDPGQTSVIVSAPPAAIPTLDRFIAMLDQTPATASASRVTVRLMPVKNAKATEVARLLRESFDALRRGMPQGGAGTPATTFSADDRTNTVIAAGPEGQLKQVDALLPELDRAVATDGTEVAMIPLAVARPSSVQRIVEAVLSGRDPARKDRLTISAADDSSLFVVRGTKEQIDEVRLIVAEVDKSETGGLPVRTVRMERADPVAVAASLRQFFEDRARVSARTGQRGWGAKVSITGDRRSGTVVYAAAGEDEEQIKSLITTFDGPVATKQYEFKIIPLEYARMGDVRSMMESLLNQVRFDMFSLNRRGGAGDQSPPGAMVVEFDERSNSVVFMGSVDQFENVERVVRALDVPSKAGTALAVKAVKLDKADPRVVASAISSALDPSRKMGGRWGGSVNWSDTVRVEVDARNRTLVLVGRQEQLDLAASYAAQLDTAASENQTIESITLKYAAADRVAQNLDRFFRTREGDRGGDGAPVRLIGSKDGNVLVVAAAPKELEVVRQLLTQMDQPEDGATRSRELYRLQNADVGEITQALREQFPASLASREGLVIVTPQPSTGSVLVSAPEEMAERIAALIANLDSPPTGESRLVTVMLATARAEDVAASLTSALPTNVKVKITPVRRSNSLLLTGSKEAIELVMGEVSKLDTQPTKAPVEFRRMTLKNASAAEVVPMLRDVARALQLGPGEPAPAVSVSASDNTVLVTAASGRIDELAKVIEQMDSATEQKRRTEFVTLNFADAEQLATALSVFYGKSAPEAQTPGARNVSIIANPAGKSLIISAEEGTWAGIRALLEKLDSDTYDASRRYEVIALRHADAVVLARSLSEAFNALINQQRQDQQGRRFPQSTFRMDDAVVIPRPPIDAREAVVIAAEPLTNSLIVSGSKDQADRVRALAAQLDVPDSAKLPDAHIIPLRIGPASQIASALRQAFTEQTRRNDAGTPGGRAEAARAVVIVGEDKSNTLIVRAEEAAFAQIKVMAETLQQEGDRSRSQV